MPECDCAATPTPTPYGSPFEEIPLVYQATNGSKLAWIVCPPTTVGNIGSSTFINNPATLPEAEGGWTEIDSGISAGASFIANGETVANAQAGQVYLYGGDGYATFTGKGGRGNGAEGGLIDLFYVPRSEQSIVIAEGGTRGGLGGLILLEDAAVVDLGQFRLFGNGRLDLVNVTSQGETIGSLAGNGLVL